MAGGGAITKCVRNWAIVCVEEVRAGRCEPSEALCVKEREGGHEYLRREVDDVERIVRCVRSGRCVLVVGAQHRRHRLRWHLAMKIRFVERIGKIENPRE